MQGDEPLIDPAAIDAAVLPLLEEPSIPMGTLKKRIEDPHEIDDPNVVKVVTDRFENAIYFSRSTIPYPRDRADVGTVHYKHIGLYAYTRSALGLFHQLPQSSLELAERLEQLRYLQNSVPMFVAETSHDTVGVDTEADLQRVIRL